MEDIPSPRNILQKVGLAPDFASRQDSDSEEELEGVRTPNSRTMNMKQESGAFLMPQLWKDAMNLNLDNITNDFLESNVTGEVMNLDDFLKELQVNELTQHTEEAQRNAVSPHSQGTSPPLRPPGHHLQQPPAQHEESRGYSHQPHLRPTNIDNLKDHSPATHSRPSVMHHVGKPPDLHINYQHHSDQINGPPVSLPYREAMQSNLLSNKEMTQLKLFSDPLRAPYINKYILPIPSNNYLWGLGLIRGYSISTYNTIHSTLLLMWRWRLSFS